METGPLCFIIMPFGEKSDPTGKGKIDFDKIYNNAILPAVKEAGMVPIRADEERTGGIIHRAMFERLILSEFAIADLTTANANVFYELGVRHAARPKTTLTIFAEHQKLPFDVNFLRSLPYKLGNDNKFDKKDTSQLKENLSKKLTELRQLNLKEGAFDSPLFQLIDGYKAPDIEHLKTDAFRDRLQYSEKIKQSLWEARDEKSVDSVKAIEESLDKLDGVETGVIVDLFLSYRGLSAWEEMIHLHDKMPVTLQDSIMIQEQLGFALNRAGQKEKAIRVLEDVIKKNGPSSESCGLLGRVYKDQWQQALKDNQTFKAGGYLEKAIETYIQGYKTDIRDAFPGINAVTLLDIQGDEESLTTKTELLPVVKFVASQRLNSSTPDYWDFATMLEISVLENEPEKSRKWLRKALADVRESWEPETTANNLKMILSARQKRGENIDWLKAIVDELSKES